MEDWEETLKFQTLNIRKLHVHAQSECHISALAVCPTSTQKASVEVFTDLIEVLYTS
jgi:hypothetical protein